MIYVGPITKDQQLDAGLPDPSTGYFLCEFESEDPVTSLSVLAAFPSIEAAYRFAEIVGLFKIDQPLHEFDEPFDLMGPSRLETDST